MSWLKGPITLGTVRTSAVLGIRLAVQTGTLLLMARLLGPQTFGAFAGVAALAVTLGTLSTFGMHLVILADVARNSTSRDEVLAQALPVTLCCSSLMLGLFLLTCTMALGDLNLPLQFLLAIGITETVLQPLLALPTWELVAKGRPARSQILAISPLALRLASVATTVWMAPEDPLTVIGYSYLGSSAVVLAIVSSGQLSPWLPVTRWRWPDKKQWRETAGYAALNITAMGPAELDKTLAVRLLPATEAGLYAAAQRTVGAITLPVSAMMLSALPRLYRESRNPSAQASRLLTWIFIITAAYGSALGCALWLAAPLLEWMFGPSFQGVQEAIRWLCLAVPGMTLRTAIGNTLMATGTPWMRAGMELSGLAALLLASMVLTGIWMGPGMMLAFACTQWTMVITGTVLFLLRQKYSKEHFCPDRSASL